jgi:hypothetical protein
VSSGYTEVDRGLSVSSVYWEVGTQSDGLVINVANHLAILVGKERDKFTEAVARAVTPGQVTRRVYPCCVCCDTDEAAPCVPGGHLTRCENGCDDKAS